MADLSVPRGTPLAMVILDLPVPGRELSPNWRGHWAARTRAVKVAKVAAKVETLRAWRAWHGIKPLPRAEAGAWSARFHWRDRRSMRDPDNAIAALKATLDGIVAAGLLADDKNLFPVGAPQQEIDPRDVGVRLVLRVGSLDAVRNWVRDIATDPSVVIPDMGVSK